MTAHAHTIALFAGVGALLTVASLVGFVLHIRANGSDPVIDNLNARIRAWWVMVALIAGAFLWGKTGVIVLFAFCSFLALREFLTLMSTRRGDHLAIVDEVLEGLVHHQDPESDPGSDRYPDRTVD